MTYPSVDALQKVLSEKVFHYATDKKKASGRALGTLVEIITFYTLRAWGFRDALAIERPLAEYGNPEITHNVEYSIHPIISNIKHTLTSVTLPLTSRKICRELWGENYIRENQKNNQLFTAEGILRNACTILESATTFHVAHLNNYDATTAQCAISVTELYRNPYAIFECKRVGIEEGMRKGPQTIEKAKQGAYVARTVSCLQKARLNDGRAAGLIQRFDGSIEFGPYDELLKRTIDSQEAEFLKKFILTVGVVSNHGNWFTADNHNKEMKVLAQSYDWLLFLTDKGLSDFISEMLLNPVKELEPARTAFLASYNGEKTGTRFTKVQMDSEADLVLQNYFSRHPEKIESWFNIITPRGASLKDLRNELKKLSEKKWKEIQGV